MLILDATDEFSEGTGLEHQPHSRSRKTGWTAELRLPRGRMGFLTIRPIRYPVTTATIPGPLFRPYSLYAPYSL